MRFVVNPRDELSFRRMVMLLPGIGPGMAQKLWIRWAACPESRLETPPESFSALMLDFRSRPSPKRPGRSSATRWMNWPQPENRRAGLHAHFHQ